MADTVQSLWDEAYQHSQHYAQEFFLNHAYLEGVQWLDVDPHDHLVTPHVEDFDRIQATMNHMRSNARTLVSQLTQQELTFDNHPTQYDDATLRAARLGESIVTDIKHRHEWEVLREAHIKSVLKGGSAIVCVDWSEKNKTTVETVLGVPEFVVEPGARDFQKARWWIKLQLLPPKEVQAMFPSYFDVTPPEADGRAYNDYAYGANEASTPLTRVLTYYERPNPLTPDGQIIVEVAGKRVEKIEKWPFPWTDSLNIAAARESLIENEAYGSTILSDVRSPQTALNAAWSGALEHLRESSTHRIVVDRKDADQIDTLSDHAGSVLEVDLRNGKPYYLTAPSLPSGTMEMINALKEEIDNLMGVHDVSRGQAPANIESGYGLSILAEKDSSPVGRLIKETARVWSRVAWMVLELHQTQVKKKQSTTIYEGTGPVRREWKGSDLLGQTDIRIPLDAIVPRSRAAQMQFAQEAVQMGLISADDPLAVMRFAKLADMPDQRGLINATLPDVSKAIRENEAVVMDEIPLPREFDEHAIHIEVHNEFRKSYQYEQLNDQQREDLDNHIKAHQNLVAQAMGQQALGENIDPRLAAMPRADGQAPLPEAPPEAMVPPAPEAAPAEEPVPADQVTNDIMAALEEM